MPHSYIIAEPDPPEGNVRRADHGLPENGFVYCSFNNTYKFEPKAFDVWMSILRETPGSVLWLFSSGAIADENLRREAAARKVAPERLVFASFLPRVSTWHDTMPRTSSSIRWSTTPPPLPAWPCS